MKDLTQGSVLRHLIEMAIPIGVGMLVQTLYYLVDLYFVGQLGDVALAGVSAAGNAMFLVIALTQILGVGTVALISHAVGRKDQVDANLVFNQSMALSAVLGGLVLLAGYWLGRPYLNTISADAATVDAGLTYLFWFTPGMAMQFAVQAMASTLRGTGIVKPTMIVQTLSIMINIILAPILIAGWGTGYPMGVAGAGLASTIAIAVGVAMLWVYFIKLETYVKLDRPSLWPRYAVWKRILGIGIPAGGEFFLMFVYMGVIYWTIRDFGAAAQAGFGLGSRLMQSMFLPAMAIAFAVPAVAGQNFGAQLPARVRSAFYWAAILSRGLMLLLTAVCQWKAQWLISGFSADREVIEVGARFLAVISLGFVFSGCVIVCSGLFQALGNTWPALLSTSSRLVTFVVPAVVIALSGSFELDTIWYLSMGTVGLQALLSLYLLKQQFDQRLNVGLQTA